MELRGINMLYQQIIQKNFDSQAPEMILKEYHRAVGSVVVTNQVLTIKQLEVFLNFQDKNGKKRRPISTFKRLQSFLLINNSDINEETIPKFH